MDGFPPTRREVLVAAVAGLTVAGCSASAPREVGRPARSRAPGPSFALPDVPPDAGPGLDDVLRSRRSVRDFTGEPLTLAQVGRLMWAAQGVTADWGGRTAPSAGALYPLEILAALPDRLLHYLPTGHRAEVWAEDDVRGRLADAAPSRETVAAGAVVFVVATVTARTAAKYGYRAARYVDLEAGHATQNLLLEAVALGLGAVPVGAFDDGQVAAHALLPRDTFPRYLVPAGVPA